MENKEYQKEYREKNKELLKEKARERYERNKEAIKEKQRAYYHERVKGTEKERDRAKNRKYDWYQKNKDSAEYQERCRRWREENKDRIREQKRAHRNSDDGKEQRRRSKIRQAGLTVEQHDAVLAKQNGVCAICGKKPEPGKRITNLCIDHDHKTKVFRGLLCHRCNISIGAFEDDADLIHKAEVYVRDRSIVKEDSILVV